MHEPYCLAMVLCDSVHRDVTTGKYTLLGTFSTVGAVVYPAHVLFCVYFAITDGVGKIPISLRIIESEFDLAGDTTNGPVWQMPPTEMDFSSPLMIWESVCLIQAILPKPGLYHCELSAGNALLMSRRILAVDGNEGENNVE